MEQFYGVLTTICFFLMGLWWGIVQSRQAEWMEHKTARGMAYSVYLMFLLPAMMGMGAQVSEDLKFLWRVFFVVAGVMGVYVSLVPIPHMGKLYPNAWFIIRGRWVAAGLYVLIALAAAIPYISNLIAPLKPLQLEGILLTVMMFLGVNVAWEFMAQPKLSEEQIRQLKIQ